MTPNEIGATSMAGKGSIRRPSAEPDAYERKTPFKAPVAHPCHHCGSKRLTVKTINDQIHYFCTTCKKPI